MSHFTRMQTQMVEKVYLMQALADLGYTCEEGQVEIRGYGGNRTRVDLRVATKNPGYDIGFRKVGNTYDIVADWWGIRDTRQELFLQQVLQRYAYHAARVKLAEQGFTLVSEEVQAGERLHLVLRRMA